MLLLCWLWGAWVRNRIFIENSLLYHHSSFHHDTFLHLGARDHGAWFTYHHTAFKTWRFSAQQERLSIKERLTLVVSFLFWMPKLEDNFPHQRALLSRLVIRSKTSSLLLALKWLPILPPRSEKNDSLLWSNVMLKNMMVKNPSSSIMSKCWLESCQLLKHAHNFLCQKCWLESCQFAEACSQLHTSWCTNVAFDLHKMDEQQSHFIFPVGCWVFVDLQLLQNLHLPQSLQWWYQPLDAGFGNPYCVSVLSWDWWCSSKFSPCSISW